MNDFLNAPEGRRMVKWALAVLIALAVFISLEAVLALKQLTQVDTVFNTISVSGTGEAVSTPDLATFSFSVSADAKNVTEAQNVITGKINQIIDALKGQGIAEKDIKTENYSVYPKYKYINSEQVADGYTASESVEVKVRKIDDAGKALTLAGEKGATNISSLNFTMDDPNKAENDARAKAIEDAKSKAEVLAKDLGVRLVRVVAFEENNNPTPGPIMYGRSASMDVGAPTPAKVPTGENKTTATVTVTYEIR